MTNISKLNTSLNSANTLETLQRQLWDYTAKHSLAKLSKYWLTLCSRMAVFDNESCWNFVYSLLTTRQAYFLKKYLGNRLSKKSHFIRVWPSNLHFYEYFKNGKMNFFQNPSLGRTPSALWIWLNKNCIIDLKIELSAININMPNYLPYLWFFIGPARSQ